MEEMVFLGYQYGSFTDNASGRVVNYAHGFFFQPFNNSNADRHTYGYEPVKLRVPSVDVLVGLQPLDHVLVYFGRHDVVSKVEVVKK